MRRARKVLAVWGCALLMLLAAGRRLAAEDLAPGFELAGVATETVRFGAPEAAAGAAATTADAGQVTVILFVDPGQDTSVEAIGDVQALLTRNPDMLAKVRALAIASGSEADIADALRTRLPASQPVEGALDPDRAVFRAYGVIALPTTFVVRPTGAIAEVLPGRSASYRKRVADAVRLTLGIEVAEAPAEESRDPDAERVKRLTTLASKLAAEGRLAQAALQLERARELRPADVGVLLQLGDVRLDLGEAEAARDAYEAVLAVEPKNRAASGGVAKSTALGDDLDAAEKALRKELVRPPTHSSLYYFLGRVLQRKDEPAKAAAAFRQAYERLKTER